MAKTRPVTWLKIEPWTLGEPRQTQEMENAFELDRKRRILRSVMGNPAFGPTARDNPHKSVLERLVFRLLHRFGLRYGMAVSEVIKMPPRPTARLPTIKKAPAFKLFKKDSAFLKVFGGFFECGERRIEICHEFVQGETVVDWPRVAFPSHCERTRTALESQCCQKICRLHSVGRKLIWSGVQAESDVLLTPLASHHDKIDARASGAAFDCLFMLKGLMQIPHVFGARQRKGVGDRCSVQTFRANAHHNNIER